MKGLGLGLVNYLEKKVYSINMSIISTETNYGGRVVDNQQGVKQFYVSGNPLGYNVGQWVYKTFSSMFSTLFVLTPANHNVPVLINNDLYITGSIYHLSDRDKKTNIQPIAAEPIQTAFETLQPMQFQYMSDISNKTHYGFLAQDVERIFPTLVNEKYLGHKSVNYQELIPILFSQIQKMQSEINELKSAIKVNAPPPNDSITFNNIP